jgi:hypothetical protein
MLRKDFGKPVINLHELSNGLIKYYNELLNQEVLGKPEGTDWGYFQSLPEVIELLASVEHFKTSRLAHYHLVRRGDSLDDQIKFYEYLNRNFYIISCRRDNLFEYALSWAIHAHSKTLNVYSIRDKILTYRDIYQRGITVTEQSLYKHLDNYVRYDNWVDQYFNVQSYFDYDTHMHNMEDYILNLDFMQGNKDNSWQDMFGQSFQDWNTCHRMLPNLMLHNRPQESATRMITINKTTFTDKKWNQLRGPDWPENWKDLDNADMPLVIRKEIQDRFEMVSVPVSEQEYNFLSKNIDAYKNTQAQVEKLREDGIMITGIPIKLQSLREKQMVIKNFDQCVSWYNQWVEKTRYGKIYTPDQLDRMAQQQEHELNLPMQQLQYVANKTLGSD